MKWAFLLLIISFISCKPKLKPCFLDATDILKGATKKLITVYSEKHTVTALYDSDWDSLKGGAYLFFPDEHLKSYTFYQSGKPVYNETYDDSGYLLQTQGSPMVDRVITELNEDSASVQVYFFSVVKSYQELNIKINDLVAVNYPLSKDTNYANMKTVSFGITTTDLKKINMYSQVKYLDECNQIEHVLSDSLFLVKNPNIGPAPPVAK